MAKAKKTVDQKIDDLAAMVKRGFDGAESVADGRFRVVTDEFDRIRLDIRDIKATLGPLVSVVAVHERETSDLRLRVSRLERKVGISRPD
ncbi:MAG: hypothetical protein AAB468_02645 [Patescibacteria group bacterium]